MAIIVHALLPATLFSIMFAMGLRLTATRFADLIRHWAAILAALASLLLVMPAIAVLIVRTLRLPSELGIGVVLIGTCPAGTFSNVLAAFGRANLALSISLTAITSLAAVITMPAILDLAFTHLLPATHPIHLPWLDTILRVALVIAVPVALGMSVRRRLGSRADRWHEAIKGIGAVALIVIFASIIISQWSSLAAAMRLVWKPVIAFNAIAVALGLLHRRAHARHPDRGLSIALAHEIRQEETGLYIALTLLSSPLSALPLLLNSIVGVLCGVATLLLDHRQSVRCTGHAAPSQTH